MREIYKLNIVHNLNLKCKIRKIVFIFPILLFIFLINSAIVGAACYEVTDKRDGSVFYSTDENLRSHGYGDESIYEIRGPRDSCDDFKNQSSNSTSEPNYCYKIVNKNTGEVTYSTDENLKSHGYGDENVFEITKHDMSCSKLKNQSVNGNNTDDNGGNNYDDNLVSCGDELLTDLPAIVPKIVHIVYLIIQILIPVLIVIFGSMDFVKAVIAQKDDEIKKGQQVFIKRLIAGVIVFFVFAIVKIIVSFAADSEKTRILDCASCIINNNEDCVVQ